MKAAGLFSEVPLHYTSLLSQMQIIYMMSWWPLWMWLIVKTRFCAGSRI